MISSYTSCEKISTNLYLVVLQLRISQWNSWVPFVGKTGPSAAEASTQTGTFPKIL
jgi:hypothetical protein